MTDSMTNAEAIQMMERASQEIKGLRKQIGELGPKAEAYDALCTVIGLLPRRRGGESIDLAWELDNRVKQLKAAEEKQEATDGSSEI
ncbi:hypothetical protein IWQ55_000286 [Labrenzia sp. EL_208]|nr:hypothetical protein [Labrenzia sp. EL_132]MBG6227094.1 hypothetical protein [Labrenzia sp. EL_208]